MPGRSSLLSTPRRGTASTPARVAATPAMTPRDLRAAARAAARTGGEDSKTDVDEEVPPPSPGESDAPPLTPDVVEQDDDGEEDDDDDDGVVVVDSTPRQVLPSPDVVRAVGEADETEATPKSVAASIGAGGGSSVHHRRVSETVKTADEPLELRHASVLLIALGFKSEILPFLALGKHLQHEVGSRVTIATSTQYREMVATTGCDFAPVHGDIMDVMKSMRTQGPKALEPLAEGWFNGVRGTLQGSRRYTLVVMSTMAVFPTLPLLEQRPNVRFAVMPMEPLVFPTNQFAPPTSGKFSASIKPVNKLGWFITEMFTAHVWNPMYARWRASVGLKSRAPKVSSLLLRLLEVPVIEAYSHHLVPRPADIPPSSHWIGRPHFVEPQAPLDTAVKSFLLAGRRPVYIYFGPAIYSVAEEARAGLACSIRDAAVSLGIRVLLAGDWVTDAIKSQASHDSVCFCPPQAPTSIYPMCCAAIVYASTGAVADVLRYGLPVTLCPFGDSQGWWGELVAQQGLGTKPLNLKTVTQQSMRETFSQLKACENGVSHFAAHLRTEQTLAMATDVLSTAIQRPAPFEAHPMASVAAIVAGQALKRRIVIALIVLLLAAVLTLVFSSSVRAAIL